MKTPYSDNLNILIALITHMAMGEHPHRSAAGLSKDASLEEAEIGKTLEAFKGLFRKSSVLSSEGQPQYGLHLRYARQKGLGNGNSEEDKKRPLTTEDLTVLLNFVTDRANQEAIRNATVATNFTAIIVAVIAAIAALTSLFGSSKPCL